jgi:hypothetical protein
MESGTGHVMCYTDILPAVMNKEVKDTQRMKEINRWIELIQSRFYLLQTLASGELTFVPELKFD